jgi:hypothetical protein
MYDALDSLFREKYLMHNSQYGMYLYYVIDLTVDFMHR